MFGLFVFDSPAAGPGLLSTPARSSSSAVIFAIAQLSCMYFKMYLMHFLVACRNRLVKTLRPSTVYIYLLTYLMTVMLLSTTTNNVISFT